MSDNDLHDDLHAMLERRAGDVRPSPEAWERIRGRLGEQKPIVIPLDRGVTERAVPRWPVLAAACVLVVAALAGVLVARNDDGQLATTPSTGVADPGTLDDGTPRWFDPMTAARIGGGTNPEVAVATFLSRRLPEIYDRVRIEAPVVNEPLATVRWHVLEDPAPGRAEPAVVLAQGTIHLRVDDDVWYVVGAFVDGVTFVDASYHGGSARSTVTNTTGQSAVIYFEDSSGVIGHERFTDHKSLTAVSDRTSVTLRVGLEGGAVFAIAEVRLLQVQRIWPYEREAPVSDEFFGEDVAADFLTDALGYDVESVGPGTSPLPGAAGHVVRVRQGSLTHEILVSTIGDQGQAMVAQAQSTGLDVRVHQLEDGYDVTVTSDHAGRLTGFGADPMPFGDGPPPAGDGRVLAAGVTQKLSIDATDVELPSVLWVEVTTDDGRRLIYAAHLV